MVRMPRERHSRPRERPTKAHWSHVFGMGQSSSSRPGLHGVGAGRDQKEEEVGGRKSWD